MTDTGATKSAAVELVGVTKKYDSTIAVDRVDLTIDRGEFFSLLGPSGCGKTTLLRLIAGFERPEGGHVRIEGEDVTNKKPQVRPTAMVFQNYALFPNMTVGRNVAYGLSVRGFSRSDIRQRVDEALKRVAMAGFSDRRVTELSGGQQQRVALARALAVEPAVLLFDEPLSNLDPGLREQTRYEIKQLQNRLGTTSIYVTHDQHEALTLSNRIGVMSAGRVIQTGPPTELYRNPATAFVASFLGGANIVTDANTIAALTGDAVPTGGKALAVRPEDVAVADSGLEVDILEWSFAGVFAEGLLKSGSTRIRGLFPPDTSADEVAYISAQRWTWVDDDRGR